MSQTTCPHCGSKNNIETAGQRYCADCGQLITDTKPEPKQDKKPVKKAEKAKSVAQKAPAPKKVGPVAPPLNLKAIEEARKPKTVPVAAGGVLDLKNGQPKPHTAKKPIGKHVPPAKKAVHEAKAEPVIAAPAITHVKVPVASKDFSRMASLREGIKSIFSARLFSVAFIASLIAAICEVAFITMFAKTGAYAISESLAAGSINAARATTLIGHAAWAGLLGVLGYVAYSYATANVMAKVHKKSRTSAHVRKIALASLSPMLVADIITSLLASVTIVLAAAANVGFLGTKSLGTLGIVLAMLINVIAVYVLFGIFAARTMANMAIVIGGSGPVRALGAGWTMYSRQFGRLSSSLIALVLALIVVAIPTGVLQEIVGYGNTMSATTYAVLTALTQAIVLIVGAVYLVRIYQSLVPQVYADDVSGTLLGEQVASPRLLSRVLSLFVIVLLVTAVLTVVILNSSAIATAIIR